MPQKSVLITGCSKGGIGSELAFAFQRAGLRVFATARTTSKIDPALVKLPNVQVLQLDVVSENSISAAVKAVDTEQSGRLDILVNNSGYGYHGPVSDVDLEGAKKMFDVNLWAVMAMTQAFLPLLVKSKGVIVNNSSVAGFAFLPFNAIYASSKAAVNAISESMRLELAPFGVKVVTLATGAVQTEFQANMEVSKLLPDSMYKKIENQMNSFAAGGERKGSSQPAKGYAESVVRDVLGGATGYIWRGGYATTVRLSTMFMPSFIKDRILLNGSGLEKLP